MSTAATEPAFLTVAEAARLLRVFEPTIYRRCADGSLPPVRLGGIGSIRIPSDFLGSAAPAAAGLAERRAPHSGQSTARAHAGSEEA
jgi:excisionase family DNA binding protein